MTVLTHNAYWFQGHPSRVAELTRILSEPPRPNLVVGDMNCHRDSPPYRLMLQAGYAEAAVFTKDAIALARRVDYLWLDNACAERLSCFSALNTGPFCRTDPDGTPWYLSDHPPLSMTLTQNRSDRHDILDATSRY